MSHDTIPLMVRFLDLDKDALAAFGWDTHPGGRYVNLDDLAFCIAHKRDIDEVIALVRKCEVAVPKCP